MKDTTHFYQNLPPVQKDLSLLTAEDYVDLPEDWAIAASDIQGSTDVFLQGRQKEINTSASLMILALLNIAKDIPVPYVFGGDGAAVAIPPTLVAQAKGAMAQVQKDVKKMYGLHLRAGLIPMREILEKNGVVKISKVAYSPHYSQAFFIGGGLSLAENLLKKHEAQYDLSNAPEAKAIYDGLECRWQDVPSEHGEVLTIMVKPKKGTVEEHCTLYASITKKIDYIYGDRIKRHPIRSDLLKLSYKYHDMAREIEVRFAKMHPVFQRLAYAMLAVTQKISVAMLKMRKTNNEHLWAQYKKLLIETTDNEKIDDYFRAVISGNKKQREELLAYLQTLEDEGSLMFGHYMTDSAVLTCLVFERFGRQVHFLDAKGGGYTLAATQIKRKMGL